VVSFRQMNISATITRPVKNRGILKSYSHRD
jgi:hypothetical protein